MNIHFPFILFNFISSLEPCLSKCGFQTSSISINSGNILEGQILKPSASFPPRPTESAIYVLTDHLRESDVRHINEILL